MCPPLTIDPAAAAKWRLRRAIIRRSKFFNQLKFGRFIQCPFREAVLASTKWQAEAKTDRPQLRRLLTEIGPVTW